MDFKIINVGSKVKENKDFICERLSGFSRHVFIHFLTETLMRLNGKDEILPPGTVILYDLTFPQYYRPLGERLNHDWIEFQCNDAQVFNELKIPLNTPLKVTNSKLISQIVSEIYASFQSNSYFMNVEMVSRLYTLLLELSKNIHFTHISSKITNKKNILEIFEQIRLDIYQNPVNTSIAKIAHKAGYTQSYFCSIYKKLFGTTPLNDLDKSRIEYVKRAIQNNVKTTTIIEDLNFSTLEYFYMWFRKKFGMTLVEYRNGLEKVEMTR